MADNTKAEQGNTATQGDHDRVAMLSLHADGKPAQYNPEIIGDPEFALEATKRQFREQAVSAVDFAERSAAVAGVDEVPQDKDIEALQKKHEAAEKSAESAAEGVVKSLKS
jgi:hypothetical protein